MNTQEYLRLCYKAGLSEEAIDQLLASRTHVLNQQAQDRPGGTGSRVTRPELDLSPPPRGSSAHSPEQQEALQPVSPIDQPATPMTLVLATAIEEYDLAAPHIRRWQVTPTVPSCGNCNRILGDKFIPRIHERSAHILQRLGIKYRKELNIKKRSEKEMCDMSYTLRIQIEAAELVRDILRHRVEVLACGGLPYYPKTPLAHL